jgi:hypothetical protein
VALPRRLCVTYRQSKRESELILCPRHRARGARKKSRELAETCSVSCRTVACRIAVREPEDFIVRFSLMSACAALAANQEPLVRNEWQGVDVDELVRAQLAHYADLGESRLNWARPKSASGRGCRSSDRSRAPRAGDQCQQIWCAVSGHRPCQTCAGGSRAITSS